MLLNSGASRDIRDNNLETPAQAINGDDPILSTYINAFEAEPMLK